MKSEDVYYFNYLEIQTSISFIFLSQKCLLSILEIFLQVSLIKQIHPTI